MLFNMEQNKPLLVMAILIGLMGDVFLFGAIIFPEQVTKFILTLSATAEYSNLSEEGLSAIRLLLGIMGSLLWIVSFLLMYLSLNYDVKSRNWIGGATVAWFVGDSTISYLTGFDFNIIFNLLLFIPIMFILFIYRSE